MGCGVHYIRERGFEKFPGRGKREAAEVSFGFEFSFSSSSSSFFFFFFFLKRKKFENAVLKSVEEELGKHRLFAHSYAPSTSYFLPIIANLDIREREKRKIKQ